MKRAFALILCLSSLIFAQQPSSLPPPKPLVVSVPAELKGSLKAVNDELQIAQLRKANLILQLRLVLSIPNDYVWDDAAETFVAPKKEEKKDEKKP